jgi:hypothetical protein
MTFDAQTLEGSKKPPLYLQKLDHQYVQLKS